MRQISKKPDWQQKIAKERIEILFEQAEKNFKKRPERSRRYVELARKIGLRYNVRFSKELKRKFCKNCNSLLIPGVSSQVRLKKKILIIKCKKCDKLYRYIIKKMVE
jgi:ribonuclease P protein subunit RPR2